MRDRLFKKFCSLAYARAGIVLKPGKEALVSARVGKRIRALGLDSEEEYLERLERDQNGDEIVCFLDAISTNFTSFFREAEHFKELSKTVGEWVEAGQRRIRIWCAASSSGEEPYTLAITLAEAIGNRPVDYRILATDISTRVLATASRGIYAVERLDPLTRAQRTRFFRRAEPGKQGEERVEVEPALREHLIFKRLNLAKPPYPMRGPLDCVFCRNVMIYFDRPIRQGLVEQIERLLKPGGLLAIGHSETLSGITTTLACVRPTLYRKPD